MTESVRFSMSESAPLLPGDPGAESVCSSAERMVRMEWPGRRCGRADAQGVSPCPGEGIWEPASETMAGGQAGGRRRRVMMTDEGKVGAAGWLAAVLV